MVITKERLSEIELLANDFFVSTNPSKEVIADNLDFYYLLADMLYNNLPKFENDEGYKFNPRTFAKKTPLENFEIIQSFYKMLGIDFNINELINDGTIDLDYKEYESIFYGSCYLRNGKRLIDCCNNGLVTDSISWVHELSHIRNLSNKGRTVTSDLLTESIASTEELIYLDYLGQIGYGYEAAIIRKYLYNVVSKLAKEMRIVFKIGLLYRELSSLSKDSYQFYYGNVDSYDEEMAVVDKYIKRSGNPKKDAEYIMAYALSNYMYFEYKKDPSFLRNIEDLHKMVNEHLILTCLQAINLGDLSEPYIEKISLALRKITL